ncbi:hypothetical protein EDD21DRAFT_376974 [Dissophora ornata]|nr:hypothetical protein EDD21DRAFT_376974 [Dissophora ornata]
MTTTASLNKTSSGVEQTLLNEITSSFGPNIEEVLIRHDVYRAAGQKSLPFTFLSFPTPSLNQEGIEETRNPSDYAFHLVATAPVLAGDPQIHLGHSLHLPWLRELKIVFRASTEKPAFLHESTWEASALSPMDSAAAPIMVDFSLCETLFSLWIEDLDSNGQPHNLRSRAGLGDTDLTPFDQDAGIRLPSRLRSLNIIGFSAERFNFGWLKAAPRLEYLQVLGLRRRAKEHSGAPGVHPSMWQWEGVTMPHLKHMAIHHSPTRHFRFQILQQCPSLESLDARDICVEALQGPNDDPTVAVDPDIHVESAKKPRELHAARRDLTTCRLEILPAQDLNAYDVVPKMVHVLQTYFTNVTRLHLDGIPARWLIEATSGPPKKRLAQQQQVSTPTISSNRLEIVFTMEKTSAQDIIDYGLVPSRTMIAASDPQSRLSVRSSRTSGGDESRSSQA